jgi:hypothetical protein
VSDRWKERQRATSSSWLLKAKTNTTSAVVSWQAVFLLPPFRDPKRSPLTSIRLHGRSIRQRDNPPLQLLISHKSAYIVRWHRSSRKVTGNISRQLKNSRRIPPALSHGEDAREKGYENSSKQERQDVGITFAVMSLTVVNSQSRNSSLW